jgi:hypothetical protein
MLHIRDVGDIAKDDQRFAASLRDLALNPFSRILMFVKIDCNRRSGLGQRQYDRSANPAIASSDDRHLVL